MVTDHDPRSLAAALAERAEAVCRRYLPNGRRYGRYWSVGNVDGEKGRSMWVRLEPPGVPGKWVDAATGEHGNLLDIIRHRVGGSQLGPALEEARTLLGLPRPPDSRMSDVRSVDERIAAAKRLWQACRPVDRTHAETYLRARRIGSCRFPALRFHRDLWYRDETRVCGYPGLVAAVTTNEGELTGVHRTWLHPRNPAKAPVCTPRKALGLIHGRAVRLAATPHRSPGRLLVGEGIESVLSVLAAIPGLPGAAALSASSLAAFEPPRGVKQLFIARDNDTAGEHAAESLATRCRALGIDTTLLVPERSDFNDDLLAMGTAALRERLAPVLEMRTAGK